jgi:hypothetical protein
MKFHPPFRAWLLFLLGFVAAAPAPVLAQSGSESPATEINAEWPQVFTKNDAKVTIYQPQVEKWEKNRLTARAAVAVETKAAPEPAFGVIWITARTDVDRESRIVTLADFALPKVNFPARAAKSTDYLAIVRSILPTEARILSLDRLEANLATTRAEAKGQKLPLENPPPRILISQTPALLVLIDGKPTLRQLPDSKYLRVINTRALVLFKPATGKFYLHVIGHWARADRLQGPWHALKKTSKVRERIATQLGESGQVDLLNKVAPDLQQLKERGVLPKIYVSDKPAELIEVNGKPNFVPIDGTQLLWLKNSANQVLLDVASQKYYVLVSGRWFRSPTLKKGKWEYVAADKLPADFAKIPDNHPRGDVLVSVAGTPQAKEAVIANEIPQTATIKRKDVKFAPTYDGDPQFQPIAETKLTYAVNSPTPIIRVAPTSFYGVENGVWFTAGSAAGPWAVATSVPPVIYTIPPSSPLYYVTNVQVYGFTPDVVYTGYTPGYFGTVVAPTGVVVYGTGWNYRPWIGARWFGRPWTYGFAPRFSWSRATGWNYGFATGVGRPWWGPVGWSARWGGTWRRGWERGWGGRYAGVHGSFVHVNNFNVYNRWAGGAVVRTRRTTVSRTTMVRGRGVSDVYAGRGGAVYRRTTTGWQTRTSAGAWGRYTGTGGATIRNLNTQYRARSVGAVHYGAFRSAGSFGGFSRTSAGGYASYRAAGVRAGVRRR